MKSVKSHTPEHIIYQKKKKKNLWSQASLSHQKTKRKTKRKTLVRVNARP